MEHKLMVLLTVFSFVLQNKIINAIECYTCDSAVKSECATNPDEQIEVEECTAADDECVTYTVSGYTRRGCFSRLFPDKFCNSAICERCNTSLCNVEIYPADRLKCYQCIGCKDVSEHSQYLLPCPIYKKGDRCYTNINEFKSVQRGCVATNLPEKCTNICLKCNYDGCNNEQAIYKHDCISCTHNRASPNVDCLRAQNVMSPIDAPCSLDTNASGLKICSNNVTYGSKEQCYTHVNAVTGVVIRGCASKMNMLEGGKTTFCYGHKCNTECVDIGCLVCNSANKNMSWRDAENCRQGVNLQWQRCNDSVYDCFSCEMGTDVRRGCADKTFRSLTNALAEPADSEEICYRCRDTDGCNTQSVRSCYQCSSLDEADCGAMNDRTGIQQQRCSTANELCASTIYNKLNVKYVLRGCESMLPECTPNDVFCVRCNASLCNYAPIILNNFNNNNYNNVGLMIQENCAGTMKFSTTVILYLITISIMFLHCKV